MKKNKDITAIKAFRLSVGFSQEELGEILGVCQQEISKWENGVVGLPCKVINKYLGLSKKYGKKLNAQDILSDYK